jgi:hypothetical protein
MFWPKIIASEKPKKFFHGTKSFTFIYFIKYIVKLNAIKDNASESNFSQETEKLITNGVTLMAMAV